VATVSGAAAFSANARLFATGAFIQKGSAALSAAPTLSVSGTQTALAAGPKLTVTATVARHGQAALSANATLAAGGFVPTLSANPVLTANASNTVKCAAAFTAPGTLSAGFTGSAVHLSANATLLAPGRQGAVLLSANAVMVTAATAYKDAQAALAANPTLTAAGKTTEVAAAALAASPVLTAGPLVTEPASAHLTAPGTLTAATSQSAAHLTAPGTLTATASATRAASAHLAAVPALAALGLVVRVARAALAANATLTATGHRVQKASAALSAAPRLTVTATRVVPGSAHLSAPGSLHAAARDSVPAAAHLAASPALTAAGTDYAACHLSAAPVLHATGALQRAAQVTLRAGATLTATAHGTVLPSAALVAGPVLAAVPTAQIVAQALLSAQASLAAVAGTRARPMLPPAPARVQPTWQRDVQHYAIEQERQRHAQALWQYGELAMFCLLWRPKDIGAGLAQRCTRCYNPKSVIPITPPQPDYGAAVEAQISAAYGQSQQYRCPLCYGTQIIAAQPAEVPGVRALIVRPAILTDTDQNQQRTAKGVVNPGTVNIQTVPDFRAHTYDYMFRSDGRRYQLSAPGRTTLRTGFATPWQQTAGIDYNLLRASLEDLNASVAYVIPPAPDLLAQALGTYTRIPIGYAWIEQINGPLIPEEFPPPAASGDYQPPVTLPGGLPALRQPGFDLDAVLDQLGAGFSDESGASIDDEAGSLA
jgi:hypothetical protein